MSISLLSPLPGGDLTGPETGQFLVFDVRDAFDNIAEDGEDLFYYWYVDWDSDNLVEPVAAGEDSCSTSPVLTNMTPHF